MKKAFTLFEIIIAIILISLLYYFAIDSFDKKQLLVQDKITLFNLKSTLLKYEFDNDIEVKCIDDRFDCFLFIDGAIQQKKLPSFFDKKPIIYKYQKDLEQIEYLTLELEALEKYDIIFDYKCIKSGKCTESIVETEEKVYIFNDLYNKPDIIDTISDINQYFTKKEEEVKDAF